MPNYKLIELNSEHVNPLTTVRAYKARPNITVFNPHWHKTYEFITVTEGILHLLIDGEKFIVHKDDLVCFSSGAIHSGESGSDGCTYRVIQCILSSVFGDSEQDVVLASELTSCHYKIKVLINDPEATRLFHRCFDICGEESFAAPLRNRAATCELFAYLLEHHLDEQPALDVDVKFNAVLLYINDHFREPITTELIADKFSFTKSYFCRKFRAETGLQFTKYVHILRIEYAQNLIIKYPELSLTEISALCGYNSPNYFSNTFKRLSGFTPKEFSRMPRNRVIARDEPEDFVFRRTTPFSE